MKLLRQLPNALTLSNLFMGTCAVLILPKNDITPVLVLMAGCLLADILDGAIARKLGVAGGLGIQLDSLADLVSFGVLPGMIMYSLMGGISQELFGNGLKMVFAAVITTSAGLRLARFNLDIRPREYFWGLPTPAGAVMVAGLGWAVHRAENFASHHSVLLLICIALSVFLAVMYQVPLKLPGLKSPKAGMYTLIAVSLFTVTGYIFIGPVSITLGIFLYVMAGWLNVVVKWY
jgi:CDP-diacylglycerol--serine O-phosphatidyltransferase